MQMRFDSSASPHANANTPITAKLNSRRLQFRDGIRRNSCPENIVELAAYFSVYSKSHVICSDDVGKQNERETKTEDLLKTAAASVRGERLGVEDDVDRIVLVVHGALCIEVVFAFHV